MSGETFLRPEVRAALVRWREVLIGAAVAGVGIWALLVGRAPLDLVGGAFALTGVLLAAAGWQRARFRRGGGGAGIVQVVEGRVTYFGPLTGGSLAIREIEQVALDARHRPLHWALADDVNEVLIPVDAEGADALFDVFARLPGLDARMILAALDRPPTTVVTLWRRSTPDRPALKSLH